MRRGGSGGVGYIGACELLGRNDKLDDISRMRSTNGLPYLRQPFVLNEKDDDKIIPSA